MKEQKQNNMNFFGRILFLILFFLMISVFTDKPVKLDNQPFKTEFFSDWHSISKAADIPVIEIPSFQKGWISAIDRMYLRIADTSLKVVSDDHTITQKYISLEKKQLLIKPKNLYQLYYLLFPEDSGEYPILS
jgi:hypothetical protein